MDLRAVIMGWGFGFLILPSIGIGILVEKCSKVSLACR